MAAERCDECGFDPADLRPDDTAIAVRSFARRYQTPLSRGLAGEDLDAVVRRVPRPGVWSALEYAAHVRDVFQVFDDRIRCAVAGREPSEPVVDWEARVASASPTLSRTVVVDEIAEAAGTLGTTLAELTPAEWQLSTRTGRGREVPVHELARIAVHEGGHHLLDVGRALRAARGR